MKEYFTTDYQRKNFTTRYAQTKTDATKETFAEAKDRVSNGNAIIQAMIEAKEFTPGGRIWCNFGGTGNNVAGQCFVQPLEADSLEAINKCLSDTALIFAKGGGVGTNFSVLRPKDSPIQGALHGSSGVCSFIDVFDAYADIIRQGGDRRAAKMTILNVDHPDIVEFIHAKTDHKRWSTTNVSVGITDKFMEAVENDSDWDLSFNGKVYATIKAKDLWHDICGCAHRSGEPGVIFLDTINKKYPLNYKYEITSTNPCVSGDTEIRTVEGIKKAEDITKEDYIETIAGFEKITSIEKHEQQPVYEVELSNGSKIVATASHIFYGQRPTDTLTHTRELRLDELKPNDRIFARPYDEKRVVTIAGGKKYKENWSSGFRTTLRIVKVSENPVGYQDVYDFYCEGSDTYIVGGCVSRGCGEQPLPPYAMCLLGSMVLPAFVEEGMFDLDRFKCAVGEAVAYLDSLIDVSEYPTKKIANMVKKVRPIGLGFTGLSDALFMMQIPYGDNAECKRFLVTLMEEMYDAAEEKSMELGEKLGVFPDYDAEKATFGPRRNSTLLSFAPTGGISGLVGVGGYGIEPFFAPVVTRNENLGRDVVSIPVIDKYMMENELTEFPEWTRFVGGTDEKYLVSHSDHMEVLKIIAQYCDSAVSKTVNLPKGAGIEFVKDTYEYCWKNGIKGCTVYVDGCREDQPVSWGDNEESDTDDEDDYIEIIDYVANPKVRPDEVESCTYKVKYSPTQPPMYLTLGDLEEEPLEIFFKVNNSQHQEFLDGLSRAITSLWRRGIRADHLFDEFCAYESPNAGSWYEYKLGKKVYLKSILHAIGLVVKKHFRKLDFEEPKVEHCVPQIEGGEECPDCHEYALVKIEGCATCQSCGYSKCG